jgi:hypothetical protein
MDTTYTTNSFTPIRRILYGNTIFSGVSGLFFIFDSNPIAKFIGIDASVVILLIGLGLVGYAALIYTNASRAAISRSFVLFTVLGDSTWVLMSILLLVTGWVPFSLAGKWAVGILAVLVDVFATLQFLEWRKM